MRTPKPTRALLAALVALGGLATLSNAQSVTTTPVGAVSVTATAGTGSVRTPSLLSFPLSSVTALSGASVGTVSSVQSNGITVTGAGWTSGILATAASPHFLKFTSGTAQGRTVLISANTAEQLTISTADGYSSTPVNLLTMGVAAGDKYVILEGDTILTLFGHGTLTGTNAPKGGASPTTSDTLQINTNNSFATFYYDTNQATWINVASEAPANNVVIRPDSVVIYNRIANSSLSLTVVGDVPSSARKFIVREGQITALSTYWPTNVTLGSLNLNQLPSWVSNANPSLADVVQLRQGSSWRSYYHDGSTWIDLASEAPSNNATVASGSGVLIRKRSTSTSAIVATSSVPYTL